MGQNCRINPRAAGVDHVASIYSLNGIYYKLQVCGCCPVISDL